MKLVDEFSLDTVGTDSLPDFGVKDALRTAAFTIDAVLSIKSYIKIVIETFIAGVEVIETVRATERTNDDCGLSGLVSEF